MTVTTVADVLKRERETQGISLEEVAQKTYIKLHYLHALEEDRSDLLPAPVYTCGYIRQYAKLLGLNGAELVNIYQQQHKPREFAMVRESSAIGEGVSEQAAAAELPTAPAVMVEAAKPAIAPAAQPRPAAPVMTPSIVRESQPAPTPTLAATPTPAQVAGPAQASAPVRPMPATFGPKAAPNPADTTNLEVRIDTRDALLAHPEAEKILSLARQQADEILAKARDEAQRLRAGAEQYADQVLSQLEGEIGRSLAVIKNGRMHLQNRQRSRRSPERLAERANEQSLS